jgi:hypothetical protein
MAMSDRNETLALEHDFPVAWTFVMILAGGLGWTMLTLIVQA